MIMINYIYNKEARALDKMLKSFLKKRTLHIEEIEVEPESRKRLDFLELKGYVKRAETFEYTPEYYITTEGKLFICSGGFVHESFSKKLQWLITIVTFIIAVWSFIRTM